MEHITFIRNAVVFNQIIKAINAVFNPTGIMSLNPTKVQGDDCWHNRYHVLCSVDLSECNKDELVREINSHYRDNNYIWRHVSAEIDENGKLNIYFYSNIDIISQFTSVDQIIRQLDNVVCRIESSIDSDRYHIGTVLVDNDLCDTYKIAVSDLPTRYYDEFIKTVDVRYTTHDPFHFLKTSVDIRHGGFDVYLFKRAKISNRVLNTSELNPTSCVAVSDKPIEQTKADVTEKEEYLEPTCAQSSTLAQTELRHDEINFIHFVTTVIDQQLKLESHKAGIVCCRSAKWNIDNNENYYPDISAQHKLVDYYRKKGWKNVDVKFQKDLTTSDGSWLTVSFILTPFAIGSSEFNPFNSQPNSSKVDVICEKLDKNISAIEQLKWLYAQTSDQVIHDRINNKIGMLVNASISLLNSFHDKYKEWDPNNKVPFIIEKLQWLINNTNNLGEMDEIIENTINRLITMAVTNIK